MLNFKNNHDFITLFENRLSEYTGAPYVALVDTCTNAIFLSLKILKDRVNEIEIPKHTYVSVPHIIRHSNITLKYREEEWKEGYQLGNTPVYDYAVGFKPNMYIHNTYMCLSFQQKKALNIGKGGAILTDNEESYHAIKQLSWDGRSDSSVHIKFDKDIRLGYHMYMPPEDAAKGVLLLNQLTDSRIEEKLGSWEDYPDVSEFKF